MTIELSDKTIGIWYVPCTPSMDWLGGLTSVEEGIRLDSRFRYYADDDDNEDVFNSEDRKKWYGYLIKTDDVQGAISKVRFVVSKMAEMAEVEFAEILMGEGGVDEFMEIFGAMPFVHMKKMTEEEARERGLTEDG